MTQPLDGLKVIEIGGTVSVSAAGKKFADFGADVIKIEPPQISEVRKIAPFPDDIFHIDKGAVHLAFDTSKRSIVVGTVYCFFSAVYMYFAFTKI